MLFRKIPWEDPLKLAKNISLSQDYKDNWMFLSSGLFEEVGASKSYLALYPKTEIISENFDKLENELKQQNQRFFGYFSYDLKNVLESLPQDENFKINLPNLWFINLDRCRRRQVTHQVMVKQSCKQLRMTCGSQKLVRLFVEPL